MNRDAILVVDDERNIRLTVGQALEQLDVEVEKAVTGEEAIEMLAHRHFALVLLDLKLPGIDGMEVLRTLRKKGNEVKIVIITAHGTIDNAVEAMKLGAVDFIQKPFTPEEIRTVSGKALKRKAGFFRRIASEREVGPEATAEEALRRGERPSESAAAAGGEPVLGAAASPQAGAAAPAAETESFDDCLEQTKAAIERRDFAGARPWIKKAISVDPSRPEGYNILGVLFELENDVLQAQRYYRAALSIDPTYEPASHNLSRTTDRLPDETLDIGGRREESKRAGGIGGLFRRPAKPPRRSGGSE